MSRHISSGFEAELADIKTQVLSMAGLVESQFTEAITLLTAPNLATAAKIAAREQDVDSLHTRIDDMAIHLIVRRAPAASDLRMVMTVIKVINDLERVGDKAKRIAARASLLAETGSPHATTLDALRVQAELATHMLHRALDGFARSDASEAASVVLDDSRLNQQFKSIQKALLAVMATQPDTVCSCFEVLEIAKAIERVGDHAKHIAEYVVYLVKGVDVRHEPVEKIALAIG